MADYTHYPIFQVNAVAPNILIIMDNSSSMNLQAYTGAYDHTTRYYGYFEPYKNYSYGSNIFVRDSNGSWDGNFLNWLCMRRTDVARKVLMGGLATARTGGGNQTNIGETPPAGTDFTKTYKDTDQVTGLIPDVEYDYLVDGGYFYVDGGTYTIRVQKDITYPDEAGNFVDGNIAGVLQKVGDKARWGLEFFNYGTGTGQSGGSITRTIGTNMTDLITSIQNTACNTWTPLAEAYYVAMQYIKQEDVQAGLDYPNNVIPNDNVGQDPYWDNEWVYCADSFVILLTDGVSTYDRMIPDSLKDYDGDSNDPGTYADYGSNHLDDVALYARTTDLRPTDLDGDQNLILYTIYAFGNDPNAENLLKDAAKNGGFIDRDGNNGPNLTAEWDADSDGDPDTYYQADNGYQLEAKLIQAINDILARASSGTAVSILATAEEGEGNLVQAYFRPVVPVDLTEVNWVGYLQSLWVDSRGYLREDTNQNYGLDVTVDRVITYFLDPATGDTKVKRFNVSTNPYPNVDTDTYTLLQMNQVIPLWEAGNRLAQRNASSRTIFTYLDKDKDGQVDTGEVVSFDTSSAPSVKPYLGVKDNATWSYFGATHDERVTNLIEFIRGEDKDSSGLRTRTLDGKVWKLGDIVDSTPVSLSKPPDNFHIIYGDESYQAFYEANRHRETVVYVGANDGMLHAFTSWKYDTANHRYTQPSATTEEMGDELWAYVPQSLLPHLKWLASPDYTHVDYVNLKPKLFDAKIDHDNNSLTPDEWRTILLAGLNMGGKHIWAEGDFDDGTGSPVLETRNFYPSYVCMDVTDPRNPTLLWERSYTDLEMTTSFPAAIKVKDKWFAVFGSGPTDYDGTSTKNGHIFVVDLNTGEPYRNGANDWLFETGEASAFMNSPVSLDKNLDFSCNAIYFGETYLSGSWKGKLYKVSIPCIGAGGDYDDTDVNNYVDNPLDATNPWTRSCLFNATKPITAPVVLSMDEFDNAWVYVGSGRYLSTDDKTNTDQQYIFGIKDPFFNTAHTADGYYHDYSSSLELQISDLLDADLYQIAEGCNDVYENGVRIGTFDDLVGLAQQEDGWIRSLTISGERILAKSTVIGGTTLTPSFLPNNDICSFGGQSYLYGFYYETGTAYCWVGFNSGTATEDIDGQQVTVVLDMISLGEGKASAVGIHVGTSSGVRSFVQQSTGTVLSEKVTPAFKIKSGLKSWLER
jgi:type IV pilus assembly protein PilY1